MEILQTYDLYCPYCGEGIQIIIDCSVATQDYIEDCQVCCRPISLCVTIEGEYPQVHASHENE